MGLYSQSSIHAVYRHFGSGFTLQLEHPVKMHIYMCDAVYSKWNGLILWKERKCNLIRTSKKRLRQRSIDIYQISGALFMKPPQSTY